MTTSPVPPAPPPPRAGLMAFAVVIAGWGLSWPVVKVALGEIEPWTFRAVTVLSGGVLLLAIALFRRLPLRIPRATWRPLLVSTTFNILAWHVFSAFGLVHMGSGHAALIAYSMPLWAALAGVVMLGERLTLRRVAVLTLGMLGIVVLLPRGEELMGESLLGMGFMLAAAVCWAIGVVHFKRVRWPVPLVVIAAWQHLIGGLPIVLVAGTMGFQDLSAISSEAVVALLFVIAVPIALCTVAWYRVVTIFPASVSSLGSLMVPVLGVIAGSLMLEEPLGLKEVIAMALICGAVGLELRHRSI